MNDGFSKFRINDDILEDVVGGVEIAKGHTKKKKVTMKVQLLCPKCGRKIDQEFYSDGTMKYPECPTCHNPLGEG